MSKLSSASSAPSREVSAGLNFGLTSGVITVLGLMVGLYAGTESLTAVVGGVLTIALADSMSDALGIHVSLESDPSHRHRDVWLATLVTFATKAAMALTFLVPLLFLPLKFAIIANIVWGLMVIIFVSIRLARNTKKAALGVVLEHASVALLVVIASHFLGRLIAHLLG